VIALEGSEVVADRDHVREATDDFRVNWNRLGAMPNGSSGSSPSSASAELQVIADTIERQRERVASVAEPFRGTEREDIVALVLEAERQLLIATRALRRAIKTLDR
jgi:hypothetical protein